MAHKKPQMLVCYLCGQQFGSASLSIHQPQCYQKQLVWWKQADPAARGPKPKDPAVHGHKGQQQMSAEDIDKFNDDQFQDFNKNLAACPNCGRTFLPDRLQVHMRSCNPTASGGGSKPAPGAGPPAGSGMRAARSGSPGGERGRSQSAGGVGEGRPQSQGRQKGQAPQLLCCYLCGKQFGTSSIGIHMPQCYDRAMRDWKSADHSTRGPKPRDPATLEAELPSDLRDTAAVEKWNQMQFKQFDDNMSQCPHCGRTFLPDRLQVHLRSCNPSASGGGSKPVAGKSPRPQGRSQSHGASGPAAKPQMLVCYLCGQQFGTASLPIHQPQCYQKHLGWWQQADPATRGPKPKDPAVHGPSAEQLKGVSVDEFNEQQFGDYNKNLAPCPNCGRTFLPDRLTVHMRSCNPSASGGGSKPPPGGARSASTPEARSRSSEPKGPGAKPQMLVCYLCGQQFGSKSLPIHQPQCYKKRMAEWQKADPGTRGPQPKDPAEHGASAEEIAGMSRDEFNERQFDDYNKNLAQCKNCGRTFASDRLEVHLRSCRPGASGGGSKPVAARGSAASTPTPTSASAHTARSDDSSAQTAESQRGGKKGSAPSRSPLTNRAQNSNGRPCDGCGSVEYDASARFCQECGQQLEASTPAPEAGSAAGMLVCSGCGEEWAEGRFCQECGGKLVPKEEPSPPAPTEAQLPLCGDCGAVASAAGARFCEECGSKLVASPAPASHAHSTGGAGDAAAAAGDDYGNDEDYAQTVPAVGAERQSRWGGAGDAPDLPQVDAEETVRAAEDGGGGEGDDGEQPEPESAGGYGSGSYDAAADDDGGDDGVVLVPCQNCGRRFAAERVAKHQKVCTSMKKRKAFNSHKARVQGTDMVGHQGTYKAEQKGGTAKKTEGAWKSQSTAFREAMREARMVTKVMKEGGDLSKLPPPTYTREELDTRVPCPHCGRKFAADTAERHIPKCATTINRPKAPPKRAPQPSPPTQRRTTPPGSRGTSGRGSAPGGGDGSPSASSVPDDVARMGVSPEKWQRMQEKKAKEWEDAFGDAPTDLNACPHCDRKFVPASLEIHLRSCGGRHGTSKRAAHSRGGR